MTVPSHQSVALRLGLCSGANPRSWLSTWRDRYPQWPLETSIAGPNAWESRLDRGMIDLAIIRAEEKPTRQHSIHLYCEQPVLVVHKTDELASAPALVSGDLAELELLHTQHEHSSWRWVLQNLHRQGGEAPAQERRLTEAMDMATAKLGVLVLPHAVARTYGNKELTYVAVTDLAETDVYLVWLREPTGSGASDSQPTQNEQTVAAQIDAFIGIVRGRTAKSSRTSAGASEPQTAAAKRPTQKPRAQANDGAGTGASHKRQIRPRPKTSNPRSTRGRKRR